MIPSKWPQKDSGGPSAASPACILKGFCSSSDLFAEFCIQHCPNRCEFGSERATRSPNAEVARASRLPGSRARFPPLHPLGLREPRIRPHREPRGRAPGSPGARSRGEARPRSPSTMRRREPGLLGAASPAARPGPRRSVPVPSSARPRSPLQNCSSEDVSYRLL